MTDYVEKICYLAQQGVWWQRGCTNFWHPGFETRDLKALVTELRGCARCRPRYRYPTALVEDNVEISQENYEQRFTINKHDADAAGWSAAPGQDSKHGDKLICVARV
ncbi:MAG: hypothetical protein Q27BPR15_12415 [Rhodobacter sp. CACIA14H1]|nr:MAG: hypothetical protein Q27BPR15_12415 [Rhodobacter sp. CACIA14H1]